MSVVLKDIDIKKRKENDYGSINTEMYDLDKYRDIAKKCISLFSGNYMVSKMIRDEDAISHVAEHIMWGHMRWEESRGRTLKSYLNQCAIWAIKSWKTKIYQSEQKKIRSLNHVISNGGDGESQQYELIADKKCKDPFDILFNNVRLEAEKVIDDECLTSLQCRCLKERYIDGKKLQQIAGSLGITRQAVNQHIKKGLHKLKERHGIC